MPAVRGQGQTKKEGVDFTEKKFAHLPMRESHMKEAPYPKSKKIDKKKDDVFIDIEDKDPVWLKDKGDHYFKRNDFLGAIRAYGRALEEDKEFLTARLNRATVFAKVRSFGPAIEDCTECMNAIEAMKPEEIQGDEEFFDKIFARALLKRAACNAWTSQFE
jgi:dyslexia susceptibility 1 candidate gene 1 protein